VTTTTNVDLKTNRELELEAMASSLGEVRYQKSRPMPWRNETAKQKEEAELQPGRELVRRSIEPFTKAITEMVDRVRSGKGGPGRPSMATKYLSMFDVETVAFIAARGIINGAAEQSGLTKIALWIASRLNDHHVYTEFEHQEPGLYRQTVRKLARVGHEGHRRGVLSHALKLTSVKGLEWTKEDQLHTGLKLVDLFVSSTGLVRVFTERRGKKTKDILHFTESAQEWLDKMHARCALLSPVYLPMVVPPVPWTNPIDGGYLDDRRLRLELVKTERRETLDELFTCDMPLVYRAVNAVQATPWRINRAVLAVAREAWERGLEIAGLPASEPEAVPPRPAGIPEGVPAKDLPPAQRAQIREWASRAAKVHSRNAERIGKRLSVMQQLWIADTFVNDEAIYFPHTLDFRFYPVPALVNPQADDLGRGLIELGRGKRVGENGGYWLAVNLANLYGFDKAPFDDRVQWVKDHEQEILDCVASPLESGCFWMDADKPWQFLAACHEWAGFLVMGEDYVTHCPPQMDGSCSGLQHFSALLRDPEGGRAVNLVPSKTKSDIYGIVSEAVKTILTEKQERLDLVPILSRKIVKQPTMTYAYSVTERGMRDQLVVSLTDNGHGEGAFETANFLAPIVRSSIENTVKAAAGAMRFLQESARVAAKNNLPIYWTSPVGLPVLQDCRVVKGKRVYAVFAGRKKELMLNFDTTKIDTRSQASGVAPNYVHSMDASHLVLCVNACLEAGIEDFSMIHDSFGVHACDVDLLHMILRKTFVDLYSTDRLAEFRSQLVAQLPPEIAAELPPLPPMGDLDLSLILESEFAFA
jgi:DNA-directed RNA polymerase